MAGLQRAKAEEQRRATAQSADLPRGQTGGGGVRNCDAPDSQSTAREESAITICNDHDDQFGGA